jgi:hypothetical protein
MFTMVGTGAGSWMVFGQDKISRSELVEMKMEIINYIKNQTPYMQERGIINQQISANASAIKDLRDLYVKVADSQHHMTVQQQVMFTRFEQLIDSQKKLETLLLRDRNR